MKPIDKVEFNGHIEKVRLSRRGETAVAKLSVRTIYTYEQNGKPIEECTCEPVVVKEGKAASRETLESLAKGDAVHVFGRIRVRRYTDSEGNDKISFRDIVAYRIKKL